MAAMLAALVVLAMGQGGAPMEWTLDQARKVWKPMVHPIQHVGVPGYEFQTGVMWDGALVLGPLGFTDLKVMKADMATLGAYPTHVSFLYGEPMRFVDRKGTNSPMIRRQLRGGRLPMPTVQTKDGDLIWSERVFAHLLGRPMTEGLTPKPGDELVTHVLMSVTNRGEAAHMGHLWIHFADVSQVAFGYKSRQGQTVGRPIEHEFKPPFGIVGGKVRYVLAAPLKGRLEWHWDGRMIEWQIPLKRAETAELRLAIPYGLVDQATAKKILAVDPAKAEREVADYWAALENGPGQIVTGDAWINDYLVAVAGQMAQQVAYRHHPGVWMYKTSPNHYEGYWPCNAAKALPTFDYRGLAKVNEDVLGGFLQMQTDEVRGLDREGMGSGKALQGEGYAKVDGFMGNFGEWTANPLLLSHGLAMWALANHYRVTRDDRWLRAGKPSPLTALLKGFDWVAVQRKRTKHQANGKRVDYWGLLPAASAHDWLAGNAMFNDGFCIYGMAETVRLLREIKHPRAAACARELADYRLCLHDAYARETHKARSLPLPDGTTIPFVPRVIGELDWAKVDWTYTLLGPMRDGAWGALDPHDKMVDWALAFCEAGMPKGEGAYFNQSVRTAENGDANWADISDPAADRHWLWRHYVEYETMWPVGWHLFLARDDLPRFFEWFANNLGFVVHQDWRVGVESVDGVPSNAPGDGDRWQAIRSMFVHERDGFDGSEQSLYLLQAIPRAWLQPGAHLAVKDMATSFGGKINLTVDVAKNGSQEVSVSLAGLAVKPQAVTLRLRSGDGSPLAYAEVNGRRVRPAAGDVIRLTPTRNAELKIVARFQ